ncbi:MAG: SMP-30/gluconolactonase/LRE family protein [Streptosporangiaceae bacterium]|jgi:sugar lactone lactonase YvrE
MKAEQITEADAEHGEGPVWSPSWGGPSGGALRWVDTFDGVLLALADDGTVTKRRLDRAIGALRPRAGGGMVVALERQFALTGPGDDEPRLLGELWDTPGVQFNDGGTDPQGRFYCGSMAVDNTPGAGSLYRLDPDGTVQIVLREVTVSNGIGWSPDGGTAYYIDTPTMRVDAFDHDLSGRRPLVHFDEADGVPDGLAVDAEGHLWVAMHRGGTIHRYRPDGTLDGVVEVPVRNVTACTFGGPRLDQLFITTSRRGMGDTAEPAAGALFRADVAVAGLPAAAFAG